MVSRLYSKASICRRGLLKPMRPCFFSRLQLGGLPFFACFAIHSLHFPCSKHRLRGQGQASFPFSITFVHPLKSADALCITAAVHTGKQNAHACRLSLLFPRPCLSGPSMRLPPVLIRRVPRGCRRGLHLPHKQERGFPTQACPRILDPFPKGTGYPCRLLFHLLSLFRLHISDCHRV